MRCTHIRVHFHRQDGEQDGMVSQSKSRPFTAPSPMSVPTSHDEVADFKIDQSINFIGCSKTAAVSHLDRSCRRSGSPCNQNLWPCKAAHSSSPPSPVPVEMGKGKIESRDFHFGSSNKKKKNVVALPSGNRSLEYRNRQSTTSSATTTM